MSYHSVFSLGHTTYTTFMSFTHRLKVKTVSDEIVMTLEKYSKLCEYCYISEITESSYTFDNTTNELSELQHHSIYTAIVSYLYNYF